MSGKDEEEQSRRGFKVEDRRRFAENEPVDEHAGEAEPAVETRTASERAGVAGGSQGGSGATDETSGAVAEMTFSTFVMGLTTQALMHLGEIEDTAHQVGRDLPAAKQMIDLLGILREKTKGNLDAAEDQLLGNMLYDLRMRYVETSRNR